MMLIEQRLNELQTSGQKPHDIKLGLRMVMLEQYGMNEALVNVMLNKLDVTSEQSVNKYLKTMSIIVGTRT